MADPARAAASGLASRLVAWRALAALDDGTHDRIAEALDTSELDGRDAALARELAFGAVRHALLYDALADRFLRRGRQPLPVRRALRLVAHQLFALDQVPPHAVGQTIAALLRQVGEPHIVGVVNAVTRRLSELRVEHRTDEGPLGRLAVEDQPLDEASRYSLPRRLVADLAPALDGHDDRAARLTALTRVAPLCTRLRPGPRVPPGRSVVRQDGDWWWWEDPQEALRGPVADGRCVVQDRTQAESIQLATPRPLERVLDLCAAPGGKALLLHDLGCRVTAADVPGTRLERLRATLPPEVPVVALDGRRPPFASGSFDLVVVDAPCSNTGVLARRPEAALRYDDRHLATLIGLQRRLLRSAADLVAPDGRLLYATCSLTPRENQGIAHELRGWRIWREHLTWPDGWHAGGYAAVLVRSTCPEVRESGSPEVVSATSADENGSNSGH